MFIAALFTISIKSKQSRCPLWLGNETVVSAPCDWVSRIKIYNPKTCIGNRRTPGFWAQEHFSFLLLKQAKHKVPFIANLNIFKYSEEIHVVLCFIIFAHVKWDKNTPPRPLHFPLRQWRHARAFLSCVCFQMQSLTIAHTVLSRRPRGKNISILPLP